MSRPRTANREPALDPDTLAALAERYGLTTVRSAYLPAGLMNHNWRLDSDQGAFAMKRLSDTDPETARRNLKVARSLTAAGIPVPRVVPDVSGAVVARALDHHYCLTQWTDGRHLRGTELTTTLATVLGETVGQLHHALAAVLPAAEPGPVGARSAEEGVAIAERYLDLVRRRPTRDAFDDVALTATT